MKGSSENIIGIEGVGLERFIIFLLIAALVSISAFEALLGIALVYMVYKFISEGRRPSGSLFFPIVLYAVPTVLSTALFNPSYLMKSFEQAVAPFLYLKKGLVNIGECKERLFLRMNYILIGTGMLLLPVIAYKFVKRGEPSLLWGGLFQMGMFYAFFALAAISLYFFSQKKMFLMLFAVFSATVFFSTKRSSTIGFIVSLLLLMLHVRAFMSKKIFYSIAGVFIAISLTAMVILVHKDERFKTLYRVVIGKEELKEETFDSISSSRWSLFKNGLQVVKNDIHNGRIANLLIGHGIRSGQKLDPKPPILVDYYESVFILSEFIERGLIGLSGILLVFFTYFTFVCRFSVINRDDLLLLPFLLMPSAIFAGAVFTVFWDAILPLYLLLYGLVEDTKRGERSLSVTPV